MKTGRALMEEVLGSTTQYCELNFWWLGQLGYILRIGNKTLLIDGYFDNNPVRLQPPLIRPDELKNIDYVLGTHDHADHIDRDAWKIIAGVMPETKFIVPEILRVKLSKSLCIDENRIKGVSEGTFGFCEDDITITGIAAAHETLDRDPASGLYPYTGYVISCNGVNIYHSGDCVVYEGLLTKLRQFAPFDIMFLPINGRDGKRYRSGCIGNMTYQEAVGLVCELRPKLAVPGHYDMFTGNTANPLDFTDYLEAKAPEQAFWVGAHGVRVCYHKEDTNQ